MKNCPYCKIEVGGNLKKCPLCQSKLNCYEEERNHKIVKLHQSILRAYQEKNKDKHNDEIQS